MFEKGLMIFILVQVINVIISTIKSVVTVNGTKEVASIISAISYTFGAVITKLITKQSFETVIIITFFTNLFGVYIGKLIVDKMKKERLWTFSATIKTSDEEKMQKSLQSRGVKYVLINAKNNRSLFNIFSQSRGESAIIKEILLEFNAKYNVTESLFVW